MKLLKGKGPAAQGARGAEGAHGAGEVRGADSASGARGVQGVQGADGAGAARVRCCLRGARARVTAAFSIVLAGTLAMGVCGGSFASIPALAAEGAAAPASAAGPALAGAAASGSADAVNATPKEEVVYARLSVTGSVDDVYVVNVLKPASPGPVTDFGSYESVQNLTDASGIDQSGDAVTVDVGGDSLSYQGNLGAHALPWDVSVAYELDGRPVEPADLGGASGKLAIAVTTRQNATVDASFFENYLLQVTVPFASDQVASVATEDGQIALAGSNTQVTFTGMPGKDGMFKVEAQVSDFSLAGISFAAVPFSMGIEAPDTAELVSGFRQLGDGVGALKAGADGLADGAGDLASGVGEVAGGVSGLAGGAGQLVGGANELVGGTQGIASGAQGLAEGAAGLSDGLAAYQQGLAAQAANARGQVIDTGSLEAAFATAQQAYVGAYAQAFAAAKSAGVSDNEAYLAAAQATASHAQNMQTALQGLMEASGTNAGNLGAASALDGAAQGLGSAESEQSLIGAASALATGASTLASGASAVAEGTSGLASGASALASGASEAASGAGRLAGGAGELSSGAAQLADGTQTLYQEVQGIPGKVQQEIDAMLADYDKSDFEPVSFASAKNTGAKLVQFVMTTDPIEAPVPKTPEEPESEQTFWDRLLALFGM